MNPIISKYLFYYPTTLLKGEMVVHHLARYREQQWLPGEELAHYQLEHIRSILHHAYTTTSFYRQRFDTIGMVPSDIQTLQDLRQVPALTKSDLTKHAKELLSSRASALDSLKTTGGSTGQAVTVRKNPNALARERAATWRAYEWASVSIGDRQARFWGVPLTARGRRTAALIDFIANRRRLSAFGLDRDALRRYYQKMLLWKPAYCYGYVSVLREFAEFLLSEGLAPPNSLRSIITTSEVLDHASRTTIKEAFGVPIFNEYGCGEVGSIAHECEHGSLHYMADNLIVEVDIESASTGTAGEIVVTDLHNRAMPLIRYRLQDYASWGISACACGRTLPVIQEIFGRAYDFIVDPSGKRHHPEALMYIFEEIKRTRSDIVRFQIIQTDRTQLLARLVVDSQSDKNGLETLIRQRVAEVVHPKVGVDFEYVDEILREKSGKLRVIKSLLSPSSSAQ